MCLNILNLDNYPGHARSNLMAESMNGVKNMKFARLPHCTVAGIIIIFVLFSGCLDSQANSYSGSSAGNSGAGSGSCSSGYARYTTSQGQCCPTGYPYYYESKCHQCSEGYNKYSTSAGYCCPSGYTHYYNGKCHECSEGYYKYDTSAGYCCQEGSPYYYDGKCHSQSSGSSSSGSNTVLISNVQVDSRTGCPAQRDLQCSGWIETGRCQIQSCTCYYSELHGDTTAAYYHTSDGAYFRCSGAGQTLSCIAAAQAAAQHCT